MRLAVLLVLIGIFLVVYVPDVGHGFLADDFAWIRQSRMSGPSDAVRLFSQHNGFYRPLVSVTFALDHAAWGLRPFGYALTNLALALATAAVLMMIARGVGLAPPAALFAAALWAFNPHGIPMALLWISGRTSLLLCLFSALAAWSVLRRHTFVAALFVLAAMLSKEEAVLLPLMLVPWTAFSREHGVRWSRRALLSAAVLGLTWIPYFALRSRTAAYLPASAPPIYRPAFDAIAVLRNAAEYADRAATVGVALLLLTWLCVRRRPALSPAERGAVLLGLAWAIGGYGLTVFLPVRSSLYACFPSMGASLAAATVIGALWRQSTGWPRRVLPIAAMLLPVVMLPIYRSRARRWVKPADLSASVVADLRSIPADQALVLHDAVGVRPNLESTFGNLMADAVALYAPGVRVWLEPVPSGWDELGLERPGPGQVVRRFALQDGRLRPVVAQ